MLYCKKCGVRLTGFHRSCPLCQGRLAGQPEGEGPFPVLPVKGRPYMLAVRLAALLTVAAIAVCAAVNFSFPAGGWWSAFVAAGLLSTWLLLWVAVRKRSNPMKAIVWQLAVGAALVLVWDRCTGFVGWSFNFVLPILIPCMQLAVAVTAWAMRLRPSDYLLYLTICVFAGLLPAIPLLCGVLWAALPSVLCGGISVVALAALVLFRGTALKDEIVRRTHI